MRRYDSQAVAGQRVERLDPAFVHQRQLAESGEVDFARGDFGGTRLAAHLELDEVAARAQEALEFGRGDLEREVRALHAVEHAGHVAGPPDAPNKGA